jgi:biopolymer transport protein ExbD
MKKIITLLLGCFYLVNANAQSTVKGKVLDDKDKPLKGAVVLLLHQGDSSLALSAISSDGGDFSFDKVANGNYRVTVSYTGYQKTNIPINVSGNAIVIPDTKLSLASTTLQEVTVTSTKPFLEQRADKLVVNIEGSATAAGSTAMEVLQKVPGVIVTNDQVKLAGKSSVNILIDGKASQYTDVSQVLSNLSASNIEKIELITNPGAKYDATGGAIINIILKKNANLGTNGTVSLATGMGLYEKGKDAVDRNYYRISPSVSINHRKGKINAFGSMNFFNRNSFNYNEFDRLIAPNRFLQGNYSPSDRHSNSYRLGMDVYADDKNTFGLLIRGFNLDGSATTINTTQQMQASTGAVLGTFNSNINSANTIHNIAADINWKHSFDSTGKELNVDFDYSSFQLKNNSDIITKLSSSTYLNSQQVDNPVKFGVFKLDYTHPLGKNSKLELGAKKQPGHDR